MAGRREWQKKMDKEKEILALDARIQQLDQRKKQIEAAWQKKHNRNRYEDRKKRTHRLIAVGAEVESVFERQVSKEELGAFREYMKRALMILGAFEPEKADAPFS